MADDGDGTSALVRDYFIKNGGKVKRHDLFDHFRTQLDESSEGKLKNQFGDIVNSLAFLQNVEGEKYFVLKKSKNGSTPILLRRPPRVGNQRKEKGVSLPSSMRSFRFPSAEDAMGNTPDNTNRASSLNRYRTGLKTEVTSSAENLLKRNGSDTSISENGRAQDSGVDTAVSLQSESPKLGSKSGSLPRSMESDRLSQYSGDMGIYHDDDQNDHEISSHVLNGFEKSWMMSSMIGNKPDIVCHIEQEPTIIGYKDFIMGYTALHWAAKQGNSDIVHLLVVAGANVNAQSNGGYTPLYLAAKYGHITIMNILIDEYNVDVHIRDHSGKEPKDVVKKDSPDQIRQKLKDPIAAMALQDLEKKSPSAPLTQGKMKRLSKILSWKHHNSNDDGETSPKIPRTLGEPMGSQEALDVFELCEKLSEEPKTEEKEEENESSSSETIDSDLGTP